MQVPRSNKTKLIKCCAVKDVVVIVESTDIERACPKNHTNCVAAHALKRVFPGLVEATFYRTVAWLQIKNTLVKYSLPSELAIQVAAYDRGGAWTLRSFVLYAPTKSEQLGPIKARSRKRAGRHEGGSGKIRRKPQHVTGVRDWTVRF